MALVSLAQNSQDHKTMENVVLIFSPEMNSFMNGDTASHAHQARYMTEAVEAVRMVETFLPTSSQLNAVIVNIDPYGLECYECPDYTRAQDRNSKCGGDKCELYQIQKVDGTCSDCPNGTRPNFKQRNCVEIVSHTSCSPTQIYVEVMNMCEECPEYTRPRGDYCAADKCADNQRLQANGMCSEAQCGELEILSNGSCEKCFPYTRP